MSKPRILVHSPRYNTDMASFGVAVPFALDRGELVLKELSKNLNTPIRGLTPKPLTLADLRLAHTERYLRSLADADTWMHIFGWLQPEHGRPKAKRQLTELIADFKFKSGGTLLAGELALKHGAAANLGGGYHHAGSDGGGGYCAINDIAITIRSLQKRGLAKTALVVDVDLHQGNGTAEIFAGDDSVKTLSIYAAEAWPPLKAKSTVDIAIAHGESDQYLPRLKKALAEVLANFKPDICIFVQGSDAFEKDTAASLRYMKLTLEQLKERDEFVIDACLDGGIPLALCFAGGYGPECWRVHYNAVNRLVERVWKAEKRS